MKQTKLAKPCLIVLVFVLACVFAVALVACDRGGANTEEITVRLIIGDGESVAVTTDAPYLYDMLKEYCEANDIALEGEDGAYGFFLTRVGELVQDGGKYIMIYHDIEDVTLYTPGYDMQLGGKTYHSASLGVSSLPLRDGATYAIILM